MPTARKMVARVPRAMGPGNRDADAYRKLLLDPCFGALVASPYELGTGSQVSRFKTVTPLSNTDAAIAFHPVLGTFTIQTGTPTVATQFVEYTTAFNKPGENARPIAGCISLAWNGAESARQGMVYCGNVPGAVIWNYLATADGGGNNTVRVLDIPSFITHAERMPVDRCEVNWVPGTGDEDFYPMITPVAAQAGAIQARFASTNFAIIVLQGGGTAANNILNITAVSEFNGSINTPSLSNAPWTISAGKAPAFKWRDVVESLSSRDPAWYINTFKKIGSFGVGLGGSYMTAGLPGALSYLTDQFVGANNLNSRSQTAVRSGQR